MAEQGGQTPTFKLVLVGDGGTGKVSTLLASSNSLSPRWRAPNQNLLLASEQKQDLASIRFPSYLQEPHANSTSY
jgi:hypothetical protein